MLEVVSNWNPNNINPPISYVYNESLQLFDYEDSREMQMAQLYRKKGVPFKLFNVPEFQHVSELWTDEYLIENLNKTPDRNYVEKSKNNHFLFWEKKGFKSFANYVPPTTMVDKMDFEEWLRIAKKAQIKKISPKKPHFYFTTDTEFGDKKEHFIAKDLQLFSSKTSNFFVKNSHAGGGIQCRFGMRGVVSESHFNSEENMIAMMRGTKRYILNPPSACGRLGIINDPKHPSFGHSVFDWSDIEQIKGLHFDKVNTIETIVRQGEVLYLPAFWFHYMESLDYSIQCRHRSGYAENMEGYEEIAKCMRWNLDKRPTLMDSLSKIRNVVDKKKIFGYAKKSDTVTEDEKLLMINYGKKRLMEFEQGKAAAKTMSDV